MANGLPPGFSFEPPQQPRQPQNPQGFDFGQGGMQPQNVSDELPPGFSFEPPQQQKEQQPPSYVGTALKAVGDVGRAVKTAVVGKQDPKFAGITTVEKSGVVPLGDLNRAKLLAPNDDAYADIIAKRLGPRLVGRTKDANGYPVFSLRGDDGKVFQAYVNRPGLDWEDVDRGISGAIPYMAGAGIGGRVLGTLGKYAGAARTTQIAGQGAIAAGVNAGQQVGQQGLGSRQPFDLGQVGLAGLAGGAGEALGQALGAILRRYGGASQELVGKNGQLTERGRRIMVENNLDPRQVDDWIAAEIGRRGKTGGDPEEILRQATADRFGIPSTKGQRTSDIEQLLIEKDIMASTYGPAARDTLKRVYQQQDDQIGFVTRHDTATFPPNRNVETIPQMINPENPYARTPGLMGESGVRSMRTATSAADEAEKAAWARVSGMQAKPGATDNLPRHLNRALKEENIPRIIPENHKVSAAMAKDIEAFIAGKPPKQDVAAWIEQAPIREIDDMRRVLLGHVRNAPSEGGDKAAAGAMYRGYLNWVDEAAANKLLTGDVDGAKALRAAMAATKEAREILDGTLKAGRVKGKAADVLQKLQGIETGEGFLNTLLGRSGAGKLNESVIDSLKAYRTVLQRYVPKEQAQAAWNDVRLAQWMRLVTNNAGDTHSKTMIAKNIKTAFEQQGSLMQTLYTSKERANMRMLANAIGAINPRDPNPSGTATSLKRLLPGLAKEGAYTQGKRETFTHNNVIMARVYRMLGSTFKTFEKPSGAMVSRFAVSQKLTPRRPTSGGAALGTAPFGASRPSDRQD